jgi:3-oxoacyl-[acyl-carrier-protein] synthase II
MFVLEDMERAVARGAPIMAEVAGHGSTCDAYHRVQIAPDIVEPVRAIELALSDAGLAKDDIGYVNLHGTGTSLNDKMETAAMKKCFGARGGAIPMSTTKSMIGHPQGAGGSAGVAATVLSMLGNFVHPTINLDSVDADCDLDYVANTAREHSFDAAVCNCIAFGSKNSALVIQRCQ